MSNRQLIHYPGTHVSFVLTGSTSNHTQPGYFSHVPLLANNYYSNYCDQFVLTFEEILADNRSCLLFRFMSFLSVVLSQVSLWAYSATKFCNYTPTHVMIVNTKKVFFYTIYVELNNQERLICQKSFRVHWRFKDDYLLNVSQTSLKMTRTSM